MGFFGGGGGGDGGASDLAQRQYEQNEVELEAKRQSLYNTRLDIIKSQGTENWMPNKDSASLGGKQ